MRSVVTLRRRPRGGHILFAGWDGSGPASGRKGRCYRAPALRLGRHDLPFITVGLQVHATLAQILSFEGLAVSSPIYPILRSAKNTLPFPKSARHPAEMKRVRIRGVVDHVSRRANSGEIDRALIKFVEALAIADEDAIIFLKASV